ncbi:MAG: GAF domain-containing protein, partial [Planctomycetes bacterium]|nr:GAF domain-containing protein [Planctomycetota bacterium]
PRDKSEIIIPLVDHGGTCWGVLDVDSHETSAFDTNDENGLRNVLRAVELVSG